MDSETPAKKTYRFYYLAPGSQDKLYHMDSNCHMAGGYKGKRFAKRYNLTDPEKQRKIIRKNFEYVYGLKVKAGEASLFENKATSVAETILSYEEIPDDEIWPPELQDRTECGHDFKALPEIGAWVTTSGLQILIFPPPKRDPEKGWLLFWIDTHDTQGMSGDTAEERAFAFAAEYSQK